MPARPANDPQRLDVAAVAAAQLELTGAWPLTALRRLSEATMPLADGGDDPVEWSAQAAMAPLTGAGVRPSLHLRADASVGMECQRCLQRMTVPVHVDRRLFFVEGEEAAASLDDASEDDVLALEPALDLRTLLEDELLLSLPLVPRHEVCPEPLPLAPEVDTPPAEHPFAALAALKRSAGPG